MFIIICLSIIQSKYIVGYHVGILFFISCLCYNYPTEIKWSHRIRTHICRCANTKEMIMFWFFRVFATPIRFVPYISVDIRSLICKCSCNRGYWSWKRWMIRLNAFLLSFYIEKGSYGAPPNHGYKDSSMGQQSEPYVYVPSGSMPSANQHIPTGDNVPMVKGFEFNTESIRRGFIRKVYSILSVRNYKKLYHLSHKYL